MRTVRGSRLRISDLVYGLLAAGLLALAAVEIATGRWHSPVPVSAVVALAVFGPVATLGRFPATSAAVSSAALLLEWLAYGIPSSLAGFFASVLLPFALGLHLSRRRWWAALVLVVDVAVTVRSSSGDDDPAFDLLFTLIVLGLAGAAGLVLRHRHRAARVARAESEQLRAEQALRVAEALAAERGRIARDLHDIVAHAVSLMVVQAAAGRAALASRPEAAEGSFDAIVGSGQRALEELRRLLGLLTATGPAEPTAGGVAGLPVLVAAAGAAGVPCVLRVDRLAPEIPPGVGLAAYRIVQEALTNVVKHAPGAATEVVVRGEGDDVVVTVANQPASAPVQDLPGSGHGLVGMRERAAVYDGRLTAAATPAGGWCVEARIPVPVAGPVPA